MGRFAIRPQAYVDLEEIAAYIASDNPEASQRFLQAVDNAFHTLADMPLLGSAHKVRSARLQGLRTYLVPGYRKYLVIYLPTGEGVEVLRVVHGARDLNCLFEDQL